MTYEQLNVRMDSTIKQAAEQVFQQLGLSATDAVRMFYHQVAMQNGLPFEVKVIKTPQKSKTAIIQASVKRHKETLDILKNR
jgi:DNA-damage-inducible protein J